MSCLTYSDIFLCEPRETAKRCYKQEQKTLNSSTVARNYLPILIANDAIIICNNESHQVHLLIRCACRNMLTQIKLFNSFTIFLSSET